MAFLKEGLLLPQRSCCLMKKIFNITLMVFDITHQNAKKMMHVPGDRNFLAKRHGHRGYMTNEDPESEGEMHKRKKMKHWLE